MAERIAAADGVGDTLNHLGKVFGQTAFKVALEQVVKGGISSLYGAAPART